MKRSIRIITSLILVIMLLLTCMFTMTLFFVGSWLHTYNVLTEQTLVAHIEMSEIKSDESGQYFDVTYTPYLQTNALSAWVFDDLDTKSKQTEPLSFKVYGDTLHVGGPIIKFYDHLALLNFKTIFKVSKLYGRYNSDNQMELNKGVNSSFDLNGGIEPFRFTLSDHYTSWPFNMFVHTIEFSDSGIFASSQSKSYNLYIRPTGFLWEVD